MSRPVLVTTLHRGVFAGLIDDDQDLTPTHSATELRLVGSGWHSGTTHLCLTARIGKAGGPDGTQRTA